MTVKEAILLLQNVSNHQATLILQGHKLLGDIVEDYDGVWLFEKPQEIEQEK